MILMYNNSPKEQLLTNSSFEEAFPIYAVEGNDWYAHTTDESIGVVSIDHKIKAFGTSSVKLSKVSTTPGVCGISQVLKVSILKPGRVCFSVLCKNEAASDSVKLVGALYISSNHTHLKTITREIKVTSYSEFNIAYVNFKIDDLGYEQYEYTLSFYIEGGEGSLGSVYLDNSKIETGTTPSKWSSNTSEDTQATKDVEASLPDKFSAANPSEETYVIDTRHPFGLDTGSEVYFEDPSDVKIEGGQVTGGSPYTLTADQQIGNDLDNAGPGNPSDNPLNCQLGEGKLAKYDEYEKRETKIFHKTRQDNASNKEQCEWYDDEEHVEFERTEMREFVRDIKAMSRPRMAVHWASNLLAAKRRAHEFRMHSHTSIFVKEKISAFIDEKYQKKERDTIHVTGGI